MSAHRICSLSASDKSMKSVHLWERQKVKCTLLQALRLCTGCMSHRGSRGISVLFFDRGNRRGEGSVSRPGRSLPPEKTRYPLCRRLGGPQGRSGQVRKISRPPGFDPRVVQPVAIPVGEIRTIYQTTRCHVTKGDNIHNRRHFNLKFCASL